MGAVGLLRGLLATLLVVAGALLPGVEPGIGPAVAEVTAAMPPVLEAGNAHNCALQTNGQIVCWGANDYSQAVPPAGLIASQVSAGYEHTCVLRKADGLVVCWGGNLYSSGPPPPGLIASQVSVSTHKCAVRKSHSRVICWGYSEWGAATPPTGLTASQVSAGGSHTCASRKSDSVTLCWGRNHAGQALLVNLVSPGVQTGNVGRNLVVPLGDLVGSPLPNSAVYVKTGGNLPAGVTLESYSVIGGRPTTPGLYNVTAQATDGLNFQAKLTYTLAISP
jgi:hypothetical protein